MNVIKNVEIINYKGLEEIQFPCESINIIIGPNNTGKSSILESIWMSISSLNNFEDALETELSDILKHEENDKIKHFIYQSEQHSKVQIDLSENNIITLDLLYSKKDYPPEIAEFFLNYINKILEMGQLDSFIQQSIVFNRVSVMEMYQLSAELKALENQFAHFEKDSVDKGEKNTNVLIGKLIRERSKKLDILVEKYIDEIIKSEKLSIISKHNTNLIGVHLLMEAHSGMIPVFKKEISTIDKIPLVFSSPGINEDILDLYKKLVNIKKLDEVLNILKGKISYLEDIREVEGDLLVLIENIKEPLPLSFMGDGFKALLKLSFMAPLVKNGVVIFEEPEVYMHPGYFDILSREIVTSSEQSQFFISTHSLELIKSIIEKAEKFDKIDSIRILRLRRLSEGYIDREILSGSEAKEELDTIETDLRGF